MMSFAGMSDDDRFLLVYNFTPSQSVTVVDITKKSVASEIEAAGCGLVFPTGKRSFAMLCSDGRAIHIRLDDSGAEQERSVLDALFDPKREFVTEKGVRWHDAWVFVTNHGEIRIVDFSGRKPVVSSTWNLFTNTERKDNWASAVNNISPCTPTAEDYSPPFTKGRSTAIKTRAATSTFTMSPTANARPNICSSDRHRRSR